MSEIDEHFRRAVEAQQAGRLREALEAYRRVLELDPKRFTALNNLGMVLQAAGKPQEALKAYAKVLEQGDNPVTRNNVGNALRMMGQREHAAAQYRRAIELKDDFAEAHSNLGVTLAELGLVGEAARHLERAVELKPDHAPSHSNLGNARQQQHRAEEALAHYRRAIELAPDYAEAHSNLAAALLAIGDEPGAIRHFERAVALQPHLGGAQRQLAQLSPDSIDVAKVEALLANPRLPDVHRLEMHFTLGEVWRARGEHERAFDHYADANRMKRKAVPWDVDAFHRLVGDLIRVFTPGFLSDHAGAGLESEQPVFIVGMPRSGTTLVEQILASHADVAAAGELPFLPALAKGLAEAGGAWPEAARDLDFARCRELGAKYVEKLRADVPENRRGAARLTDKLPDNFLRLGLIRLILPNARIIHCRREPRDTAMSIFFHHFSGLHPYAWDLGDIGVYYREYLRLMEHWRSVIPADRLLEVQYEDVVADLEGASRRMIDFLGLPWDPRCLEFHRTERFQVSASNAEVRRPLYRSAIGRWRLYEKHLAPFTAALEGKGA